MRVAIVTESFLPTVNGVTNSVLRVLEHLATRGHEAIVICPGPAPASYADFPVREVAAFKFFKFNVGMPTAHVQQALDDFGPDVVHVAGPFAFGSVGLMAAAKLDLPVVAIYQTDMAGFATHHGLKAAARGIWVWVRQLHEMADLTLAPTRTALRDLVDHGVPRLALWGRGVDTVRFHPSRRDSPRSRELRARLSPNGEVVVGYVGRLFPEKRVERLAALGGLPGIQVAIVGDGPSRASCERAFAAAALPTTFLGHLDGDDLGDAYAAFDVFVHTGTEETFGQTLQEAMATRLPVVAPAAGGPVDIVEQGVTGFLYSPEDDTDLRRRIAEVSSDAGMRERMGEAGRRAVLPRSWESVCDELLDHYGTAIDQHDYTQRRSTIDIGGLAAGALSLRI